MVITNEVRRVLSVSIPEEKISLAVEGFRNGRSKSEEGRASRRET
jgi:hypothetical protein